MIYIGEIAWTHLAASEMVTRPSRTYPKRKRLYGENPRTVDCILCRYLGRNYCLISRGQDWHVVYYSMRGLFDGKWWLCEPVSHVSECCTIQRYIDARYSCAIGYLIVTVDKLKNFGGARNLSFGRTREKFVVICFTQVAHLVCEKCIRNIDCFNFEVLNLFRKLISEDELFSFVVVILVCVSELFLRINLSWARVFGIRRVAYGRKSSRYIFIDFSGEVRLSF